jgi:hypothetical protein
MKLIPPCIPDGHPHRVKNTRCRIDTVISPDDGHIVARNMYRIEINTINTQRRNCAPGWFYLQDYTRMHGQQNIKNDSLGQKVKNMNVTHMSTFQFKISGVRYYSASQPFTCLGEGGFRTLYLFRISSKML